MYLLNAETIILWEISPTDNPPTLVDLDVVHISPSGLITYFDSPIDPGDYTAPTDLLPGSASYPFTPAQEGLWKVLLVIGDSTNYTILSKAELFVFDSKLTVPPSKNTAYGFNGSIEVGDAGGLVEALATRLNFIGTGFTVNTTAGTVTINLLDFPIPPYQSPQDLIDALVGSVGNTLLDPTLNTRINLIDGVGVGTVNDRIATVNALVTALDADVYDPSTGLNANAAAIVTLDALTALIEGTMVATSGSIAAFGTTVGNNETSIQTQTVSINGLEAKYTVKVDNNGYVSGFGLASDANNGVPFSKFNIVADAFTISEGVGAGTDPTALDGAPFFHITSPTLVNGVTIPAGTYMKRAFIADATITNAMIGNVIQSADGGLSWKIDKDGGISAKSITLRDVNDVSLLSSDNTGRVIDDIDERATVYRQELEPITVNGFGDLWYDLTNKVLKRNIPGNEVKYLTGNEVGAWLADTTAESVVGAELVTNGGFATDSDWTKGTGWAISVSEAHCDGTQVSGTFLTTIVPPVTVAGVDYVVTFEVTAYTAGKTALLFEGVEVIGDQTATGVYSASVTASDTTGTISVQGDTNFIGSIDNVTLRRSDSDLSTNDHDLAHYGTITKAAVETGSTVMAYSGFNASNYLEQSYDAALDLGTADFTIVFWVKILTNPAEETIMSQSDATFSAPYINLAVSTSGTAVFETSDGTTPDSLSAITVIDDGEWRLMGFVYDSVSKHVYINGSIESTSSPATRLTMTQSDSTVRVGARTNNSLPFISGSVALCRVLNTALTATEILDLYNKESPIFNPAQPLIWEVVSNDYPDTETALEAGTTITQGGITLSGGGKIQTLAKDTYADITPGFFMGWDTTENDYVINIGDNTNYMKWDGTSLSITGSFTISNPVAVRTTLNVADGADVTQAALIVGTTITGGGVILNAGGAFRSTGLTSEAVDATAGVWLGYNGTNYTFGVGDGAEKYIKYNGTDLIFGPGVKTRGGDFYENDSIYWHTYWESIDRLNIVGSAVLNINGLVLTSTTSQHVDVDMDYVHPISTLSWTVDRKFKTRGLFTAFANLATGTGAYLSAGKILGIGTYGVGFKLLWNSTTAKIDIYGRSANNGTFTDSLIMSVIDYRSVVLEAVFRAGIDVVLTADDGVANGSVTITTNLPTGAGNASLLFRTYIDSPTTSTTVISSGEFRTIVDN